MLAGLPSPDGPGTREMPVAVTASSDFGVPSSAIASNQTPRMSPGMSILLRPVLQRDSERLISSAVMVARSA